MTVKIVMGCGLGNQLFQYAAGRALAIQKKTKLLVDPMWCAPEHGNPNMRRLEIVHFPLKAEVIRYSSGLNHRDSPYWRVRRKITDAFLTKYHLREHIYDPNFWNLPRNVKLSGYYLSPKYFENQYKEFSGELDLTDSVSRDLPREKREVLESSVAVHVRRGDYLTIKGFPMVDPIGYYEAGIEIIREKLGRAARLLVFSDDIGWCREQEVFAGAEFWEPDFELPHKDLFAMAGCQGVVMANSTFSWWGAWFASQRGRPVIAPKTWTKGLSPKVMSLYPADWAVI